MGALGDENGRETGGTIDLPSRASALCTSAFRAKTGGREGHFRILENSSGSEQYANRRYAVVTTAALQPPFDDSRVVVAHGWRREIQCTYTVVQEQEYCSQASDDRLIIP